MTIDNASFRATLSKFATGVTVVTTRMDHGHDLGITVNSFASVSLDPPLVLWSLDRTSDRFAGFDAAGSFVINVLGDDQIDLSRHFAALEAFDFSGVAVDRWNTGCPVLTDTLASIECTVDARHDGGDHVIYVGRVERLAPHREGTPLVFFQSGYCCVAPVPGG